MRALRPPRKLSRMLWKTCGAFSRTQRRAIRLHESKVRAVVLAGGEARIRLSAYVEVSNGEPGNAAGTAWEQELELVVGGAALEGPAPAGALWVSGGHVAVGSEEHELLALPLEAEGAVRVALSGAEGRLRLTGTSIHSEELAEPRFLERLQPS